MLKLLIADDEPLIRKGIRFMIERSPLSFNHIFEADSGRTAVNLTLEHSPEIILMDIKMPGMCGISAAKEIIDFDPHCKIIFLTAYDRFDFAQKAIRCKAQDFLVKPVSSEDLIRTIQRCHDEINQYILDKCREEQLFFSIEEFLVNEFIAGTTLSADQIWSKMQIISPSSNEQWFSQDLPPNTCLVINCDGLLPDDKVRKTRSISMKDASFPLLIKQIDNKLVCLTSIPQAGADTIFISVELAKILASVLFEQNNNMTNIGIGRVCSDLKTLSHSYAEACTALEYNLNLASKVDHEKYEVVHIDSIDESKLFSRPYQMVQQVINYLNNNYNKKIGLEEVAQKVFLSPVYLSTIVKQVTGYTFSDYINHLRVEKAKELLRSHLPVKEVAKAVGYMDSNYFCRVFKKATGVTATSYKNKIM